MQGGHLQNVFCIFHLLLIVNAHSHGPSDKSLKLLDRLLGSKTSKPIVVYVGLGSRTRSSDFDDLLNTDDNDGLIDDGDDGYRAKRHRSDDDAYFLYHLLRNIEDRSSSSTSSSSEDIESTKQVLRTALRARCQKVESCVRECPPKKPSCPMNCQQVFDNLNMCPPPPPPPDPCQKKPKCGRTMPPSWRF